MFKKKVSLKAKQTPLMLILMFLAIMSLWLVGFINQTNLGYIPRAAENKTDDGVGISSPGTSGPIATNSASFNCHQSQNTCAEEIPCGYCRQHDSDCRLYLCVGPNYPRANLPTYGYSVYMPYSQCPKPTKLKTSCTTVVSWNEEIDEVDKPIQATVAENNTFQTLDNHSVVFIKDLGYLLIE